MAMLIEQVQLWALLTNWLLVPLWAQSQQIAEASVAPIVQFISSIVLAD